MENKLYKPRIIDKTIKKYLETFGAVCVEGPKWCGKTWTSAFHAESVIYIGDPGGGFQNRSLAQISPSTVLIGEHPRLIDEWQEVPQLWDAVRFAVDQESDKGLFILTGSATPHQKGILHSGAGRISRLRMRPMSLYESGASTGEVSLKDICNSKVENQMTGEIDLMDIIHLIIKGGWPANQDIPTDRAGLLPTEYLNAVLSDDISRIDGKRRDAHKMELLLRSLARHESTTATQKKLCDDIKEIDDKSLNVETVSEYLDILDRLFITDNQKPYGAHLRSAVRVKQSEKRHLADPSLACALLKATPEALINDLNTLGFLFEALCERDLKIYAEAMGAELLHYQDYNNKEIDAIISMPDGSWSGFEIKLGANQIDDAAANLLKIQKELMSDHSGTPAKSLCVLCGMSNAVYTRPDGVIVAPITALAP